MKTIQYNPDDKARILKDIEWARRQNNRANGIYYQEESGGEVVADFILFPAVGTSEEEIEKAKRQLEAEHTVVGITVLPVPPEFVADDERDKKSESIQVKIEKIREIVVKQSFNKVDGVAIDLFSASAIIAIYDALSPENREKFGAMPIPKMANIAFQLLNKK